MTMRHDGQLVYDFNDFHEEYGHPAGRLFTVEVTYDAITYVYADVIAEIRDDKVILDLNDEDLVVTRKAH